MNPSNSLYKSDTNIDDTLIRLGVKNLDATLLVPTPTGIKKGYMDATKPIREYLKQKTFHNYELQGKGQKEHGVFKSGFFVTADNLEPIKGKQNGVSLYRPKTKRGDPRIWFSGLRHFANPYNLLAIYIQHDTLFVINCSRTEIIKAIESDMNKKFSDFLSRSS